MKIQIIGGGMAGFAAAIALARKGAEVDIFERAPKLEEIGAGVQISPNGTRILRALGVFDLIEGAYYPPTIEMRHAKDSSLIFSLPFGTISQERWGDLYFHIHRADLLDALARRAKMFPNITLHLGQEITADLENSNYDLIIGADGVHSQTRNRLITPDHAVYSGFTAWRALINIQDAPPNLPLGGCVFVDKDRHFVTTRVRGGKLVNLVGIARAPSWKGESWHLTGDHAEARAAFSGVTPLFNALIDRAPEVHRWALLRRPPLEFWSKKHCVIIGDAAHPMFPSYAQGAVAAFEDAWALAHFVSNSASVPMALERFFRFRHPRATRVQQESYENLQIYHRTGMRAFFERNGAKFLDHFHKKTLITRQDWLYSSNLITELENIA